MFLTCKANFNGYFTELSENWTDALGWSIKELKSKPYTDFLHPDDYEKTLEVASEMVQDPNKIVIINFENRYLHKNGKYVWIRWRAYTDFEKQLLVCNVSALINHETKKLSGMDSEFWNSFVNNTPSFISVINSNNQIEFINKNYVEIPYVQSLENVLGKRLHDVFPDEIANKIQYFVDECKENNKPYTKIFENNIEGNQYIVNFLPTESKSGKISRVICEMYSTKSWAYADNESHKIIDTLQEKVSQKNNQVVEKAKELENLAYASSHNLKAPLTNIQSILELIKSLDLIKPEGEELLKDAQKVIENTLDNSIAINNLLRLSGSGQLVKKNINIKTELFSILEAIDINQKDIFDFSELNCKEIFFSGEHFTIIMQNIISNSVKYRSADRDLKIQVKSTCNTDGDIFIELKDNGIGFDSKKYKSKLFQPFSRLSGVGSGEGLGLYIINNILQKYNGNISIHSMPDEGTSVKIKLKNN